ncbi:uncharacterized protein LOC130799886 [Amaranthus tricolor]|uniref:uncharacterized protein LOC130799886 n=1 Tax=Amaranthus tricolor TaxID=29722 RepID=UPI00258C6A2C|nr:uncharacterized protein LOC130799886 [Amaranthus tricolor]XP_057519147.1 uncharacterized protein LOC130799886 [Amaranthus tricolor]
MNIFVEFIPLKKKDLKILLCSLFIHFEGFSWVLFSVDSANTVVVGPPLIQEMIEQFQLIRKRMKAAQDRQKSYADQRRRPLEFQVGDKVFLRVSPTRGVMRFGKKGKLSPRFIGPYEILERIGEVAYRLALPASIDRVHDVFHVSQLRQYIWDDSHVLQPEQLTLDDTLQYKETPIQILDKKTHDTRPGSVALVKVLWSNHVTEEATWEAQDAMRRDYPWLFA